MEMAAWKDAKNKDTLTSKVKLAFEQRIAAKLKEQYGKCAKCERTENLTLDHLVPQSLLRDMGVDIEHEIIEDNYQILCRICNQYKSSRLDFANPQTKVVLVRLLERL